MKFMAEKARQWKMYVAGTLLLKEGDVVYNSAPLWDRQGKLVGIYRKTMLYEPELDDGTTPGEQMPVFHTDFGAVGIMTCYDSWFPSTAELLALKGAEVILFPSDGYYMQLMHARAADNGVVIAASCDDTPAACGIQRAIGPMAAARDVTRCATSIVAFEKDTGQRVQIVTLDLSAEAQPCLLGRADAVGARGPPCPRHQPRYLEDEIAREVKRWCDTP